jgi:hypothetical protein
MVSRFGKNNVQPVLLLSQVLTWAAQVPALSPNSKRFLKKQRSQPHLQGKI